ncbi:MAG: ABC transporter permease [Thermoleophilia bacterium]|nr:ABC transporter permease [Thermoleophilia bacterium]
MSDLLPVGVAPVTRKEMADQLSGLRFAILLVLIGVAALAAVYVAGQAIRDVAFQSQGARFVFLALFTVSDRSLPSFISFVAFLGPLLGIALGFDSLNSERSQGTLSRLIAQPIHRDAVLHGKFLAGLATIGLALGVLLLLVAGLGLLLVGVPPSSEEVLRLILFFVLTVIYVGFWLALAQLFSVVFRQAATSALAAIAVWLFFAIFAGLLVGLAADAFAPVGDNPTVQEALRHEQLTDTLNRISPVTLYSEATTPLLNPSVRSLGVLLPQQVDRALAAPLGLGQSVLLVWPQVVALVGAVLVFFALGYVLFMREEVRA